MHTQAVQNWVNKSFKYETLKSGCAKSAVYLHVAQKVSAHQRTLAHQAPPSPSLKELTVSLVI